MSETQAGLSIEQRLAHGLAAYERGQFEEALQHWFAVVQSKPDNRRAQTYLSFIRRMKPKLYREAERRFLIEENRGEVATRTDDDSKQIRRKMLETVARKLRDSRVTGLPTFRRWKPATDVKDGWENTNSETEIGTDGLERKMRELDQLDDCSGLFDVANTLLSRIPGHQEALKAKARAENVLAKRFVSKLGSLDVILARDMSDDGIIWQDLNSEAAFILGLVDGTTTAEDVVAASGLPESRALGMLALLKERGIISAMGKA